VSETGLVIIAAVLFLAGIVAFCVGAIYYSKAKIVHANAERLLEQTKLNHENSEAASRHAEDLLSRIQEHAVL